MRSILIAAMLVPALAVAQTPPQDPKAKAEADAAYADGQKRYTAGDYVGAAEKFQAAYALDPDPAYLFNIAQAYRFGNACAKAADAYRKFLAVVPNAPNAIKVHTFIEQSDDCAKKQATIVATPPPPTPGEPEGPPPRPLPAPRSGRTQRIAGLSLFAGGVVAIGVAGFYTRKGAQLSDDRDALCAGMDPCQWDQAREDKDNDLKSRGRHANLIAYIGWSAGGALVIGGVLLYVLAPEERERFPVAVVPTADGVVALTSFRF